LLVVVVAVAAAAVAKVVGCCCYVVVVVAGVRLSGELLCTAPPYAQVLKRSAAHGDIPSLPKGRVHENDKDTSTTFLSR
jgi:hypothetical protein